MRQCGAEINATRKRKETVAAKQNQTEPWISLAAWCRTWRRFHTCNFWTGPNSEVWTKQAIVKVINNTFAFPAISSQQVRDDKYPDQWLTSSDPSLVLVHSQWHEENIISNIKLEADIFAQTAPTHGDISPSYFTLRTKSRVSAASVSPAFVSETAW